LNSTREMKFVRSGSKTVVFSDVTAEQTGMIAGRLYRFSCIGGQALVRWGADDATVADGGYDFAVVPGAYIDVRCPPATTAFNVIESDAGSIATATLIAAAIDEGV
jgi:hypothetical protein